MNRDLVRLPERAEALETAALSRLLRARYAAPVGIRYPTYLATLVVVGGALAIAGLDLSLAIVLGAAAGFGADSAIEAWWRRRERRRDLANAYVPRGESSERQEDDGAP
jgi:hypothetical protein